MQKGLDRPAESLQLQVRLVREWAGETAALLRLPEDRCILPLYKLAVGSAARGEMTIAGELEGEWQW